MTMIIDSSATTLVAFSVALLLDISFVTQIWDSLIEDHAPIPAEDKVVKLVACADWQLMLTTTPQSYGINPVYQWNPEMPDDGKRTQCTHLHFNNTILSCRRSMLM